MAYLHLNSPASPLSSCSSEIEDAASCNHVANSLNMEIADLDNVATCDGTSLFDRVAVAVEASCSAGRLRGDVFGSIEEVLEGEEWIDDSGLNNPDGTPMCPCLSSLLSELRSGESTNCVDFGIDFFEGNTGNNLRFEFGLSSDNVVTIDGPVNNAPYTSGIWPSNTAAFTSYSTNGEIIIAFDPNFCGVLAGTQDFRLSGYQMAATILHETRHAVFLEVFNDMDRVFPH